MKVREGAEADALVPKSEDMRANLETNHFSQRSGKTQCHTSVMRIVMNCGKSRTKKEKRREI
jgi:hypothetical protein